MSMFLLLVTSRQSIGPVDRRIGFIYMSHDRPTGILEIGCLEAIQEGASQKQFLSMIHNIEYNARYLHLPIF